MQIETVTTSVEEVAEETVQVIETAKDEKESVASVWSGEVVEDPDTEDINLLLENNFKNYQLHKKNSGDYLVNDEDEVDDLHHDQDLLTTNDTDGDDEYEEEESRSDLDGESDTDLDQLTAGEKRKRGWGWRVARIAVPLQFALISLFCVARLFEPQCCDVVNNFSMSFTPHLRYVRGPPPM